MTPDLFPASSMESPSPRILWVKKHNIHTARDSHFDADKEYEPWSCWQGELGDAIDNADHAYCGYSTGMTEDDAICAWARDNGVHLWHEEKFVKEKKL